jgi:hypothetical protein
MSRIDAAQLYATDEDLLIAAPGDFSQLVPVFQRIASGTDGALTAGSFNLTSSVNFQAQGVAGDMVLQLRGPVTTFKSPEPMVVASVAGTTVTLRRAGLDAGQGQPPASASLTNVEFLVATLRPQIERATYELNQRFGIDNRVRGRSFADFYDVRELQDACVMMVLAKQYRDMARQAGREDDFSAKAKMHDASLAAIINRVQLHMKGSEETKVVNQVRVVR